MAAQQGLINLLLPPARTIKMRVLPSRPLCRDSKPCVVTGCADLVFSIAVNHDLSFQLGPVLRIVFQFSMYLPDLGHCVFYNRFLSNLLMIVVVLSLLIPLIITYLIFVLLKFSEVPFRCIKSFIYGEHEIYHPLKFNYLHNHVFFQCFVCIMTQI